MSNSPNTNAAGIKYGSDGNGQGFSLCTGASELSGDHGVVSAQIANISLVSGSYTTNKTQLADAQSVAINALIAALINKGTVAAS